MNPDEFNKYCAEVIGIEVNSSHEGLWAFDNYKYFIYSPYDDLNHMVDVVEKLMIDKGIHITLIDEETIKQSFRNFIISTMEDK